MTTRLVKPKQVKTPPTGRPDPERGGRSVDLLDADNAATDEARSPIAVIQEVFHPL